MNAPSRPPGSQPARAPRKLWVIGVGVGDPDHLTLQALKAMRQADVFFMMDKGPGKAAPNDLRRTLCEIHLADRPYRLVTIPDPLRDARVADYKERVRRWHAARRARVAQALRDELAEGQRGAFLVWGDPALYDSTLRMLAALEREVGFPLEYQVVPGISAAQALAAQHRIPLHEVGEPVLFTTGRKLREGAPPAGARVVWLDGECSFQHLCGRGLNLHIYWGAYLGAPYAEGLSGPLDEAGPRIIERRAALRRERGWIMDIYALLPSSALPTASAEASADTPPLGAERTS